MLKLCQNNEEKMVPHESTAKQVSLMDNSLAMGEGYKCYSKCCQLIPTRQALSEIYSSATS